MNTKCQAGALGNAPADCGLAPPLAPPQALNSAVTARVPPPAPRNLRAALRDVPLVWSSIIIDHAPISAWTSFVLARSQQMNHSMIHRASQVSERWWAASLHR